MEKNINWYNYLYKGIYVTTGTFFVGIYNVIKDSLFISLYTKGIKKVLIPKMIASVL